MGRVINNNDAEESVVNAVQDAGQKPSDHLKSKGSEVSEVSDRGSHEFSTYKV